MFAYVTTYGLVFIPLSSNAIISSDHEKYKRYAQAAEEAKTDAASSVPTERDDVAAVEPLPEQPTQQQLQETADLQNQIVAKLADQREADSSRRRLRGYPVILAAAAATA